MPESKPLAYAAPDEPSTDDLYQLRVLAVCYWALGAILAFGGVMVCVAVPLNDAGLCGTATVVMGTLSAIAGLFLYTKQYLWFILCVSAFMLLVFPFGTILGVATIGVLRKPAVAAICSGQRKR